MDIGSQRGCGKTTAQLEAAPHAAIFITMPGDVERVKQLASDLGRADIRVVPGQWLATNQWKGTTKLIILDHAWKSQDVEAIRPGILSELAIRRLNRVEAISVPDNILDALMRLQYRAWNIADDHGWHEESVEDGTLIALMHSELSEALEGMRHENPPSDKIPNFTSVEEELADVMIRIMDAAEMRGWRVMEALLEKMTYNESRPCRHGGKRF